MGQALRSDLESREQELARRTRAAKERSQELTELRRKLDKTKKRAYSAHEETSGLEGRVRELEETARRREVEAREARAEVNRLEGRLQQQEGEGARFRARLATSKPGSKGPNADPEELARLTKQVAAAKAELKELTEKLLASEREASRYRSRERTHRRLYLIIKGELDVAKDRLRLLEGKGPGPSPHVQARPSDPLPAAPAPHEPPPPSPDEAAPLAQDGPSEPPGAPSA
jgi:chromosome segregation ATPase